MASFEVCHVSAHKCNPASKVLGPGDVTLFTPRRGVHRKDALYVLGLRRVRQNQQREKRAMRRLEKAEPGERRQLSWRNPGLDMHGSLVRGGDCEELSSHEIHLDSVRRSVTTLWRRHVAAWKRGTRGLLI